MKEISSGLYLVSTPIGNLSDITLRAIEVLKQSDIILCEDTRVSKKLLDHYQINKTLFSYHKFNEKKLLEKIIQYLNDGKIISLISDAGTPLISDPGRILVNELYKRKIKIIPIPGPSAASTAYSLSGFSYSFYFVGFLPKKSGERKKVYNNLKNLETSLVFFISGRDIEKILNEFDSFFGNQQILIAKELTKIHETIVRGNLSTAVEDIGSLNLKGEFTVVLSNIVNQNNSDFLSLDKEISLLNKKMKTKDLVNYLSEKYDVSKKIIYSRILNKKND
jgi:16S rRNA (cytidine1402-2'-O)-methyltransferase